MGIVRARLALERGGAAWEGGSSQADGRREGGFGGPANPPVAGWLFPCRGGPKPPIEQDILGAMPVVVTGESWLLRGRAVEAFARSSPEVRAYVQDRRAREHLRAHGAKVATGSLDDIETLATVMDGAHTLCHLPRLITESGEPAGDVTWTEMETERQTIGMLRPVLAAATRARIQRMLLASYPGASIDATNPYLRGLGAAERAVAESGIDHVIVRCTHVYGPSSEWIHSLAQSGGIVEGRRWQGRRALWPGSGQQLVAPVEVSDVGAVLAAADDREGIRSGTYGLEGPDRVTADQLAALAASMAGTSRVDALGDRSIRRPRPEGVHDEIVAGDSLADAPDAAAAFGVERTSLVNGLKGALSGTRPSPEPE
jgi:uncharacterized protein YbjT (DUF2867 family)